MTAHSSLLMLLGLIALGVVLGVVPEQVPAAGPPTATANFAVTANNELAFDLYNQLANVAGDQSLFFSPYSISNALVIVAEGARQETADEIGKALRFPPTARRAGATAAKPWDLGMIHPGLEALNKQFEAANRPAPKEFVEKIAALQKDLAAANKEASHGNIEAARKAQTLAGQINALQALIDRYELRVANALWGEKTYPFKQSFLDTISKYYGASAFPVDFRHAFEAARKHINAWVEERTRSHIKNLIPAGAVNQDTTLVVTNAIYFKGLWTMPFQVAATKNRPFTLVNGKTVQTPTMHAHLGDVARYAAFNHDGTFFDTPRHVPSGIKDKKPLYPDAQGFEMLELPYKGNEVSMVVIAPCSAKALPALEKRLTAGRLHEWIGKLQRRAVHVEVPKFKMESSITLNKTLQALGMKRAFRDPREKDPAQFDGMSDTSDPLKKLYISKVLHNAFVEVSEKGTEAAAATAVIMTTPRSVPAAMPFTPTFKADKPFVFLIRDQKSGAVLFLGRVMHPKAGG